MSLKAFHILFIFLAILLAIGCAWWGFANEVPKSFSVSAAVAAVALTVYGVAFIRKARKIIV